LNNWVDLECQNILRRASDGSRASEYLELCDAIRQALARAANSTDNGPSAGVYATLAISVGITSFEYDYLVYKLGIRPETEKVRWTQFNHRLTDLLRLIVQRIEFWPDWYGVATYLSYLRSGSPYLTEAWTPRQFDELVARARE